jgi:hypothetical protein
MRTLNSFSAHIRLSLINIRGLVVPHFLADLKNGRYRKHHKFAVAGTVIFAIFLIFQLFFHKPASPASAFVIDEKNPEIQLFTMVRRPKDVMKPIPSGNPTPLPTFTPTPTPTHTPTPTPTPTSTPTPTPSPTRPPPPPPGDLDNYFKRYAAEYNADEGLMRKIAVCESGYNASSHNTTYDYAGMYQFSKETWMNTRSQMGQDNNPDLRFNAEESIKTAAFKISRGGAGAWAVCAK